jgi:hypothetical protein
MHMVIGVRKTTDYWMDPLPNSSHFPPLSALGVSVSLTSRFVVDERQDMETSQICGIEHCLALILVEVGRDLQREEKKKLGWVTKNVD